MKKGVNAWIYPSNFEFDKILDVSARIGFDGIELNLDEEMLKLPKEERKTIVEKATSLGLELPSLCSGLFWKFNLASPDKSCSTNRHGIFLNKAS
jgi:L-ribulose-5-phosphate 3-epimerase